MSEVVIEKPSVDDIEEAMRDVVDPELGINVVDLGLVYEVHIDDDASVTLDMTLTSAACPLDRRHRGPGRGRADRRAQADREVAGHQLGVDAAVGSGQDHRRRVASSSAHWVSTSSSRTVSVL